MFFRYGLSLALGGIALGVVGALVLARILSALLYGVRPVDAPTYLAASVVLGAAVVVAAILPVRRASRVDPVVALKADG